MCVFARARSVLADFFVPDVSAIEPWHGAVQPLVLLHYSSRFVLRPCCCGQLGPDAF